MNESRRDERFSHVEVIRFRPIMVDGSFSMGEVGAAQSGNVSSRGIFIETKSAIATGTALEIYIREPSGLESNVFGIVRQVRPEPSPGLGIEVLDVSVPIFLALLERAQKGAWTPVVSQGGNTGL